MNFIQWLIKFKIKLIVAITTLLLVTGVAAYLITGKAHNPITHIASKIIEKETNIDVEDMLPADDSKTTP